MARGRKASKAPVRAAAPAKPATNKKNRSAPAAARTSARAASRSAEPVRLKPTPRRAKAASVRVEPGLFEPLSEGERCDAVRILTEDRRLGNMAKVARYRVIAMEPLAIKPPSELSGRRLARIAAFDYASDRTVDAVVDLDASTVVHLTSSIGQPALARDEEAAAVGIALSDERVKRELGLSDEPMAALHYWSRRDTDLAFSRRSAAVLFGQPGARPSLVAVVDLVDRQVTDVVSADQW